jgi:hypothetical protein
MATLIFSGVFRASAGDETAPLSDNPTQTVSVGDFKTIVVPFLVSHCVKCHILETKGESYRLAEAKKRRRSSKT